MPSRRPSATGRLALPLLGLLLLAVGVAPAPASSGGAHSKGDGKRSAHHRRAHCTKARKARCRRSAKPAPAGAAAIPIPSQAAPAAPTPASVRPDPAPAEPAPLPAEPSPAPAPADPQTTPSEPQPTPVVGRPPLRWAPPRLVDPITISLGDGYTNTQLAPDRDYVIKLPPTRKVGGTTISGGHNVVIVGGWVTIPPETTPGTENDAERRAIYIKNATGTVHVEGVLIDGSGGGEFDGIDINAPEATVQLENNRVIGVRGGYRTMHADIVQPWGGVADLRIDRLTGASNYQGLQLAEDLGPIGSAEISNVDLTATGEVGEGDGGYLLWLAKGAHSCDSYPVTLDSVYVKARPGRTLPGSVWPPATGALPCRNSGTSPTLWPQLPVLGGVAAGPPPGGEFVPAGTAGLGYGSPGYSG